MKVSCLYILKWDIEIRLQMINRFTLKFSLLVTFKQLLTNRIKAQRDGIENITLKYISMGFNG